MLLRNITLLLSVLTLLAACDGAVEATDAGLDAGADPDAGPTVTPDGLWLVQTVVQGPVGRTSYLQTTESVAIERLDTSAAIEIAGAGRVFDRGDADVFFGGGLDAPTVTRFEVGADGAVTPAEELSFASLGFSFLPFSNTFVSDTRAFLLDEFALTGAIWNPEAMTLDGEIDLSALERPPFSMAFDPGVVRGDRVYVPIQYTSATRFDVFRGLAVAVLDAADGTVLEVLEDERCVGGYDGLRVADDGTIYAVGEGYSGLVNLVDATAPDTCMLRIPPGATDFDPDWQLSFPDVLDGRQGLGLILAGDGVAFVPALYPERIEGDPAADPFAVLEQPAAKWWRVDLEARTGAELALDFQSLRGSVGYVTHGRVFLARPQRGFRGRSQIVEVDPATGEATERMQIDGTLTFLRQIREP